MRTFGKAGYSSQVFTPCFSLAGEADKLPVKTGTFTGVKIRVPEKNL